MLIKLFIINTGSLYSDYEISHSQGLSDIYALQDQNFTLYFRALSFGFISVLCEGLYCITS